MGNAVRLAWLSALLLLPVGVAAGKQAVQVEDHGGGHFTLTTTLSGTTDPGHGQLAIVPTAEALCGQLHPHYGHYRFESLAPTAEMANGPSLRYTQDVRCTEAPQQAALIEAEVVPPAPATPPTDEDNALIRSRTLEFLQAKATADAKVAFPMLSKEMRSYSSPGEWTEARRAFNAKAGPGAAPTVVRLTWYDDPVNAPSPGRYVAADYRVDYPSSAFTCGFLVWLRQRDGNYLIVREETGEMTPEILAALAPEQKSTIRAQLQCRD